MNNEDKEFVEYAVDGFECDLNAYGNSTEAVFFALNSADDIYDVRDYLLLLETMLTYIEVILNKKISGDLYLAEEKLLLRYRELGLDRESIRKEVEQIVRVVTEQ